MAGLGNSKKFDAVEEVELLVMDKPMVVIEEEHLGDRFPVMLPRCTERKPSIKRRVVTRDEPLPDPLPDPLSSMNEREPPPYRSITNDSISRCYQDQVDGKIPSGFEPEDEHEGIDASDQQSEREKTEEDLKKVLLEGDFDAIQQKVTPKTLARCKSNTLLKAFQVSKQLRDLAHDANPEKDDLDMLEKSIDGFTSALIDPLKADDDTRNTFRSYFDDVVDEAIDMKQKKFISHPVVYNLLKSRWYRSFCKVRKESWWTPKRWGYLFLNLWTVFDIAFFPLLFAIFFVLHKIKRALRRKRETKMCFVLTLGKDTSDEEFDLIKKTIMYITGEYGCHSAKYCVVLHENSKMIKFEESFSTEDALRERIDSLKRPNSTSSLCVDLMATRTAFANQTAGEEAKKVVVLFLNNTLHMLGASTESLLSLVEEMKENKVNIFPVGIGEHAKLSELGGMATKDGTACHFGEYESHETLGTAVVQGIEGKNIYEKYKDYFTTPYFVFVRDTLSYLTLLGLHFTICLSPSTVAFRQIEWFILVFFLGRVLMEVDQFLSAKNARINAQRENGDGSSHQVPEDQQETNEAGEDKSLLKKPTDKKDGIKAPTLSKGNEDGSSYQVRSPEDEANEANEANEENEAGEDNILLKNLNTYFSDRWNVLDFIILVFYLITFILRIITWKSATGVSDNRLLAVSEYSYGFIAMFLTLRAFGQVIERVRRMGEIQIALFFVFWDVMTILWQFLATILAFSLAMTKVYVAEKAYTSGKDSEKDLACSESGIICWWTMATHLGWSLLGLADLDAFNSVDNPSVSLIHVLYSFFLVMAVILLINMMIALLSNTYQQVKDNSLQEWSFKRAITVRTYSTCHPIPVPLNLLSVPLIALWNLCRKCSCKTSSDSPDSPEGGRKEALDKVVNKLQRVYFEKYGYEFPLTEGKKIDHLVQENEGSRKLTDQIVQQVFRPRGNKEEKLASGQSAWYASPGISIVGCLLTYMGSDCDTCKTEKPNNTHSAKFKSPFTRETPRFEVLIQETGERRMVALGVVYESYDCHSMPGWYSGTVGYHVDDGKIFDTDNPKCGREVEGAMAYRGDLIACEVDFENVSKGEIPVLFSLNGKEVARSSMKYTLGQELFPFVSLGYEGITVLAKMCCRDRDRFSGVTNEDIQEKIEVLRGDVQHQLAEQARNFQHQLTEQARNVQRQLAEQARNVQHQLVEQARNVQHQFAEQARMLSEMRNLVVRLKEVKDKEEQETG